DDLWREHRADIPAQRFEARQKEWAAECRDDDRDAPVGFSSTQSTETRTGMHRITMRQRSTAERRGSGRLPSWICSQEYPNCQLRATNLLPERHLVAQRSDWKGLVKTTKSRAGDRRGAMRRLLDIGPSGLYPSGLGMTGKPKKPDALQGTLDLV